MTTSRAALRPAAITPDRVGPRLALITAVLAMAVMFGVGLFAGRIVVVFAGWSGAIGTWVPVGVGGAAALFSAQGSARRMLRARRRRRTAQ